MGRRPIISFPLIASTLQRSCLLTRYTHTHTPLLLPSFVFLYGDRCRPSFLLKQVPSLTPLLGCQDGNIYSLRDSSLRHRLPIDAGIPTAIQLFQNDGGTSGEWVIYGTSLGQIGLVRWSRAGPTVQWVIQLPSQTTVTSLDFYDFSGSDAGAQLIVGREDCYVDVYQVPSEDDATHISPTLIFSQVHQ